MILYSLDKSLAIDGINLRQEYQIVVMNFSHDEN